MAIDEIERTFCDIQVGVGMAEGGGALIRALEIAKQSCEEDIDADDPRIVNMTNDGWDPETLGEWRKPTGSVVTLDGTNAYNLLSRFSMLCGTRDLLPNLYAFIRFFYGSYGTALPLYFHMEGGRLQVIKSWEGVQQGDGAGPICFAAGIHHALKLIRDFVEHLVHNLSLIHI